MIQRHLSIFFKAFFLKEPLILFFLLIVALAILFLDLSNSFEALSLPFFALGGGGGGGGGGNAGSGGTGNSSTGNSAASSSTGGYSGSGLGGPGGVGGGGSIGSCDCACDCNGCNSSDTGSCASASCSTPFLYVQNKDGFLMDNDVMFGKPSSLFKELSKGVEAFKEGQIKSDLYLVQKQILENEDGEVKLQIREIEPEVSAIFQTSLKRLSVEKDEKIYVTSDFGGCVSVSENKIATKSSGFSCVDMNGRDLTQVLNSKPFSGATKEDYVALDTDDYLDISFKAEDISDKYLILESWYRDWTLGSVYSEEPIPTFQVSPYKRAMSVAGKKFAPSMLALFLGYLGFHYGATTDKSESQNDLLTSHFNLSANRANADTPHTGSGGRSLVVSYSDTGVSHNNIDVVEPRYARPYAVAVKIPKEALTGDSVNLRITATKRHRVSALSLVEGTEVKESEYEPLKLAGAYHHREGKDFVETLSVDNDEYLKTYPSDIVTLTFKTSQRKVEDKSNNYQYLLSIGGVYAPATKEEQSIVGDWVSKLDEEAKEFISSTYLDSFGQELKFKQ